MKRIEVSCITKTDRDNPHERISHIGGTYDGTLWKVPIEEAIERIEKGFNKYYVKNEDIEVDITIVESQNGNKYLRTKGDDTEANNLLELPQCSSKH